MVGKSRLRLAAFLSTIAAFFSWGSNSKAQVDAAKTLGTAPLINKTTPAYKVAPPSSVPDVRPSGSYNFVQKPASEVIPDVRPSGSYNFVQKPAIVQDAQGNAAFTVTSLDVSKFLGSPQEVEGFGAYLQEQGIANPTVEDVTYFRLQQVNNKMNQLLLKIDALEKRVNGAQ